MFFPIQLQSHSKINLFLDIVGKDPNDNYHYLESIFTEIDWGDEITVSPSLNDKVVFTDIPSSQIGEINTVSRAVELFKKKYKTTDCFQIEITKKVPMGAGLGGGSGDAGAVLKWLSNCYGINPEECIDIAQKIGSDVPFFLYGGSAKVTGKGEKVTPLKGRLSNMGVLIIYPEVHICTKKAFEIISLKYETMKENKSEKENIYKKILKKEMWTLDLIEKIVYNIFDNNLQDINRKLFEVKKTLQTTLNPNLIFMTGSGSSFVLLFDSLNGLEKAKENLLYKKSWSTYFS